MTRTKPNAPERSSSEGFLTNWNVATKSISATPANTEINTAGRHPRCRAGRGRGVHGCVPGGARGGGPRRASTAGLGRVGGFGASNHAGWPQFGHRSHAPEVIPAVFNTVPQPGHRSARVGGGVKFVDSDSSTSPVPDGIRSRRFDAPKHDRTRTVRETEWIRGRNARKCPTRNRRNAARQRRQSHAGTCLEQFSFGRGACVWVPLVVLDQCLLASRGTLVECTCLAGVGSEISCFS